MISKLLSKIKSFNSTFKESSSQSSTVVFKGFCGKAYYLKPTHSIHGSNAYGYLELQFVCAFESMNIHENMLVINHFSMLGGAIGKGLGAKCLKDFASMIRGQNTGIDQIYFELYKTSSTSDTNKLSEARKSLFERVGVEDIAVKKLKSGCIETAGIWPIKNW